jgi:hypothetical protein
MRHAACTTRGRSGQWGRAAALIRRTAPQMGQQAVLAIASISMNVAQPLVLQRTWRETAARRNRRWAWARWLRFVRVFGERDNIVILSGDLTRLYGAGHHLIGLISLDDGLRGRSEYSRPDNARELEVMLEPARSGQNYPIV